MIACVDRQETQMALLVGRAVGILGLTIRSINHSTVQSAKSDSKID
jgi:hypothetical protein